MSLRARVVNGLRKHPRLYDAVVGFSRALGKRDPLYQHLARWARGRGEVHFLQVGANDGMANDPIREFVVSRGWHGLVVEPLPHLFARLVRNYAHCHRVTPVQCAVGYGLGERATIYRIRSDRSAAMPAWADQIASFDRDHLLKHFPESLTASDIEEVTVPVLTLEALVQAHKIERCDLLHLDVEGFEANLLLHADLATLRPQLILYESAHLSAEDAMAVAARLTNLGYRIETIGCDALALLMEE